MISKTKDGSLISKNIYTDKKGRNIFYKKSTNMGYVITPGSEKKFFTLSSRPIAALVAASLFIVFWPDLWFVGIIIAVLVYAYMEVKFRKLLNEYPQLHNFDPSKLVSTDEAQEIDKNKMLLKSILCMIVPVLLIINAYTSPDIKDSNTLIIAHYVISIAFILYGANGFIRLTKKKK